MFSTYADLHTSGWTFKLAASFIGCNKLLCLKDTEKPAFPWKSGWTSRECLKAFLR